MAGPHSIPVAYEDIVMWEVFWNQRIRYASCSHCRIEQTENTAGLIFVNFGDLAVRRVALTFLKPRAVTAKYRDGGPTTFTLINARKGCFFAPT